MRGQIQGGSSTGTFSSFQLNKERREARAWSRGEDAALMQGVALHGVGQWKAVAQHVAGRSGDQCCQRWMRALSPAIRKGPWAHHEDAALLRRVAHHGEGAWHRIAAAIPGRTDIQCRSRWLKSLRKRLVRALDATSPALLARARHAAQQLHAPHAPQQQAELSTHAPQQQAELSTHAPQQQAELSTLSPTQSPSDQPQDTNQPPQRLPRSMRQILTLLDATGLDQLGALLHISSSEKLRVSTTTQQVVTAKANSSPVMCGSTLMDETATEMEITRRAPYTNSQYRDNLPLPRTHALTHTLTQTLVHPLCHPTSHPSMHTGIHLHTRHAGPDAFAPLPRADVSSLHDSETDTASLDDHAFSDSDADADAVFDEHLESHLTPPSNDSATCTSSLVNHRLADFSHLSPQPFHDDSTQMEIQTHSPFHSRKMTLSFLLNDS